MKILIIGNGSIGNINNKYYVSKHTANFCKELVNANLEVGFFQFNKILDKDTDLLDSLLDDNIKIHSISNTNQQGKLSKLFSYILMCILTIRTILKYDFIYIFYPGHIPIIASFMSILFRKNFALYIRGQHNIETSIGKYIINKARFCLTVSDLLKEQISINNKNVEVIAPMIDFSKDDILLNRSYSDDGKLRCLFVGRIEFRKGIYDLLSAIEFLNTKYDYLHFDIVGGGDSFDKIKDDMKDVLNVTLHGQISDKQELSNMYKKSDIFIFPSHDEGFPRVLYEAMMLRVPIITTMVGGIGGFMKDKHNCLSIQSQNYKSIVATIDEMINNDTRPKLVNQATQDILKLFEGNRKKHSLLLMNKLENIN
jgi:glycosyltransferase involved in cell wall biosynthesis